MTGVERSFECGDDAALGGERGAANSRAGGGWMATAAELRGDLVHINVLALGAEADAGQVRFHFLENAGYHHRRNRTNMVDEPFGITAVSAGALEVSFLEPEISDLVLMGEPEMTVHMAQQPGP